MYLCTSTADYKTTFSLLHTLMPRIASPVGPRTIPPPDSINEHKRNFRDLLSTSTCEERRPGIPTNFQRVQMLRFSPHRHHRSRPPPWQPLSTSTRMWVDCVNGRFRGSWRVWCSAVRPGFGRSSRGGRAAWGGGMCGKDHLLFKRCERR